MTSQTNQRQECSHPANKCGGNIYLTAMVSGSGYIESYTDGYIPNRFTKKNPEADLPPDFIFFQCGLLSAF